MLSWPVRSAAGQNAKSAFKPHVRFSQEQTLTAPLVKLVACYSHMAERQCEAVNRIVSGKNFWGGVAWRDQDFRSRGPGSAPVPSVLGLATTRAPEFDGSGNLPPQPASSVACLRLNYLKRMTLQSPQFLFGFDNIGFGQCLW